MSKPEDRHDGVYRAFAVEPPHQEELTELDLLLAAAKRQLRVVIVSCVIAAMIGVGFTLTAAPEYTASASILIDHRRLRAVHDANDVTAQGADLAGPAIDSQVELLKSDKIAQAVIDKLQLTKDQNFIQPKPGLLSRLFGKLRGGDTRLDQAAQKDQDALQDALYLDAQESLRLSALNRLRANLDVRRVQRTLVLEIRYQSPDRLKAAAIANGYAEAYLMDQLESKYDATRRASSWLLERIAELKQQVLTSDLAIQKFKTDNDLVSAGGKLMSEQQLGEVNTQLVTARAETAKADARYQRIKAIIDNRQTEAVVTEAIGNNIIEQLRTKYLTAAKREAEFSAKLGTDHGAVTMLRMEMRDYERLMFDELGRISESYLSELVIARSREKSLRDSLKGLVGVNASANENAVALRELERETETYRTLYLSFMQRYQEAVQQQSFPITEARVITPAMAPTAPSHPKKSLILALSVLIGGAAGAGIGVLRELLDRACRTEGQVRDELGLEFLGMLPLVDSAEGKSKKGRPKLYAPPGAVDGMTDRQPLSQVPSIMRYAIDNPLSSFAETLRSVRIAADLTLPPNKPKVIGIVSILPNEGKSTVAKNFGSLLAHQGGRAVLIDADLRNPRLTFAVAPTAKAGLVQAVLDRVPLRELLLHEQESKLAVLPAVMHQRLPHVSELLASPGMRAVLKQAEQDFEWIVVDLPPLGPVVDVRAVASLIDAFVLVVEWGKTTRRLVRATLEADRQVREKCLGVVFNKVDMKKLKLYEAYNSKAYYSGKYSDYYRQGT